MMATDRNPFTRVVGLSRIAAVHKSWGRFTKSLEVYRHAEAVADSAKITPQTSALEQSVGALFFDADRFDDAIAHYHRAAALDSLNPGAVISEARVQAIAGNQDKALELTRRLRDKWANRVDSTVMQTGARELAAYAAFAAGDYQRAIENFLAARTISGDTTGYRARLAEAYMKAERYPEAISELTAFRNESETDWPTGQYIRSLYLLAEAQVRAGRPKDAIEPLQRFLVFWGNADWDLPIVKDAKQLYSSLSAQ